MNGRRAGPGEVVAVWALWSLSCIAVVVTYARVPVGELYHVSGTGLDAGLGRALVLLNFPIALVAIAAVLVALDVLPAGGRVLGAVAIVLAAVVAVPGVVDQDDLDARPVNAVPALGVLLAVALTIAAVRRVGAGAARKRPGDRLRVLAIAAIAVLSLPWLAAELGFHLPGGIFLTGRLVAEPDGTRIAAVHLGHHHGLDGALLAITAIVLSRVRLGSRRLQVALAAYLALMLAYGLVNAAQDFWLEQAVKRGWSDHRIPDALHPALEPIWLVILALAAAAYLLVTRPRRAEHGRDPSVLC